MVAEVVLSVMGNRSDRRFANLSNSRALEAVDPIRTRRADFHQGPEHSNKAPYRGRIYDCNRLRLTPTNGLALGPGSIYGVRWIGAETGLVNQLPDFALYGANQSDDRARSVHLPARASRHDL